MADRLVEAEEALRKAVELAPQRVGARALLSQILLAQGRGEEALEEAMREPEEWARLWALATIHHAAGRHAESDEALGALIAKYGVDSAYQIAEVYAMRGEAGAAFGWLERAHAQRDGGLAFIHASPPLRPLHDDPRWIAFLRMMGSGGSD